MMAMFVIRMIIMRFYCIQIMHSLQCELKSIQPAGAIQARPKFQQCSPPVGARDPKYFRELHKFPGQVRNRGSFRSAFISPSRDPTFVARMPEYISSAGVLCICMYFWLDLNWTGEALGWVGTIGGEWWGELCVG